MSDAINKVLSIANAEIGYLEKKTNAYLDDKTKNKLMLAYLSRDVLEIYKNPFS